MFSLFPNPRFVDTFGFSETEGSMLRLIQEDVLKIGNCFRVEHSESNLIPGFYKLLPSLYGWSEPVVQRVRDGEPYGPLIKLSKEQAKLTIITI